MPGSDLELIGPRGSIGPIERVQPIPPVEPPTVDLPVHFVSNRGQWAEPVAMAALGGSAMTWLFDDGFAQRFERWAADDGRTGARSCAGAVVRTRFLGAAGTVHGEGRRCSSFHFLHGGDSITDRGFERARIRELLPGIDLVMRPQGQQKSELAYDLYLQPGVDLAGITAECEGAASLSIAADGALCIAVPLPAGESVTLRQSPPVAWQPTALGNQPVDVSFRLLGPGRYGFAAPELASDLPLVIDPGIVWSTLLGGGSSESIHDLEWLPGHGVWVGGYTGSTDFPTTTGAFQLFGGTDGFIARLEEDGRTLVWASYLGGSRGEEVRGIAVDAAQTVAAVGWTRSLDFPVLPNAFQPDYAGGSLALDIGDGFYTRLSADGSALIGGSYLGGELDDVAEGIEVNAAGDAFIVGWSNSSLFPTTAGAFQPGLGGPVTLQSDGFVARLDLDGRAASYVTYLGGSAADQLLELCVDAASRATVVGHSISPDFPTSPQAYQAELAGVTDLVLARLDPDGGELLFSTYLGGSGFDAGQGLAVAGDGSTWVVGGSQSEDLPSTAGALQPELDGQSDAFLARLSPSGSSLSFLTYLGGAGDESGHAIALLPDGSPVVVGDTSAGLPLTAGAPQTTFGGGSQDAYIAVLEPTGAALRFATLFGGNGDDFLVTVAVAPAGTFMVGGYTFAEDFPTTAGALQTMFGGQSDGVVALLDPDVQVSGSFDVSGIVGGQSLFFTPGDVVDSLGVQISNATQRVLMPQSVSVFVGGTGDPAVELDGLSLWIDEPGVPGTLDLLIDGPAPVLVPDGEVQLSATNLPLLNPGDEVLLRLALHSNGSVTSGVEYQCALLGSGSWTVQAEGAGTGPQVAVSSKGRIAGAVATSLATIAFPGDTDADGLLTVADLRRLCRNIGNAVALEDDPDGDGQITLRDVELFRDAILDRPIVIDSPAVVLRDSWVRLDGYFPEGSPVVTLGGSSLTIGAATPRGISFQVAASHSTGPHDIVIAYGLRREIVCPVTVQ